MKKSDINQGKTYKNKGAGRTKRTVLKIILHPDKTELPLWFSPNPPPADEPVVIFKQHNHPHDSSLYLCSFASWAGSEVV